MYSVTITVIDDSVKKGQHALVLEGAYVTVRTGIKAGSRVSLRTRE